MAQTVRFNTQSDDGDFSSPWCFYMTWFQNSSAFWCKDADPLRMEYLVTELWKIYQHSKQYKTKRIETLSLPISQKQYLRTDSFFSILCCIKWIECPLIISHNLHPIGSSSWPYPKYNWFPNGFEISFETRGHFYFLCSVQLHNQPEMARLYSSLNTPTKRVYGITGSRLVPWNLVPHNLKSST